MRRFALTGALALALAGCGLTRSSGQTVPMQQGQRTPAAAGSIAFKANEKGNNEVTVQAKYLPIPADLASGVSTYVVWLDAGNSPVPVGTLEIAGDKRNAELKTSTPFHDFQVLVTAERQPAPARPSKLVVLRGQVGSGVAAAYGGEDGQRKTTGQSTQQQPGSVQQTPMEAPAAQEPQTPEQSQELQPPDPQQSQEQQPAPQPR